MNTIITQEPPNTADTADTADTINAEPCYDKHDEKGIDEEEFETLQSYESALLPKTSHDGLAFFLGQKGWNTDAKYVSAWSRWLFFNGNLWVPDERMSAYTKIRSYLRLTVSHMVAEAIGERATAAALKRGESILSSSGVSSVEVSARSNPKSAANIDDFDQNLMLLGTPAGIVDLKTGEFREGRREDMITRSVAVAPASKDALPVRWCKFLHNVMDGDEEVILFLQRAFGYSLTGSIQEQKVPFFFGDGGTGKGVILNTALKLMGDYSRKAPIATFARTHAGHPTDLAGLADVRFVVVGEIPKGMVWNDAIIKDVSGGDEISARFMRGNFFDFMPQMTVWMQGNTKPSFAGVDGGLRRRMILVKFPKSGVRDEDRDNLLVSRMVEEEGPEILRWMIEGAVAWHETAKGGRSGLAIPARLIEDTNEYMDSEDSTKNFFDDEFVIQPSGFVSNADIYTRWTAWNEAQGNEHRSQSQVIKDLVERDRSIKKDRNSGARGLRGLQLLDNKEKYKRAAMSDDGAGVQGRKEGANTAPF